MKKRQEINAKFKQVGPKALSRKNPTVPVTAQQADEITAFWRDIWGKTGQFDKNHRTINLWKSEMREQTEPLLDEEPADWKVQFELALMKTPS